MISQIIKQTPMWVWIVLALFVVRGIKASQDRIVSLRSLFLMPVILIVLSLEGIVTHYGRDASPLCAWGGGLVLGALVGWPTVSARAVGIGPSGQIVVRGSWMPLTIFLGIFLTKYVTEVMLSIRPDLMLSSSAVLAVCTVYGAFNGLSIVRTARLALHYSHLQQGAAGSAIEAA